MIAKIKPCSHPHAPGRWQARFLQMLPLLRRQALFHFRGLTPQRREEFVQETLANCCLACYALAQRRKWSAIHPSPLVRYAVAQVRAGRQVGCSLNSRDVSSPYAQRRNGFHLERLENQAELGRWQEVLLADERTPVDEQAAFRVDFPAWLARLSPRQRQIATFLAVGHSTSAAARRFGLSAGRISQLRRQLHRDWLEFQGADRRQVDVSAA